MRKKLSQAVARSTFTDSRDVVIVDTQILGFEFRVRRSGSKIWTYRYRNPEGRQRRYIMGRFPYVSATAARRPALMLAVEVANGCDMAWLLEGWRQRQKEAGNQPVTFNRAVQRLHALLARAVEWKVLEKGWYEVQIGAYWLSHWIGDLSYSIRNVRGEDAE